MPPTIPPTSAPMLDFFGPGVVVGADGDEDEDEDGDGDEEDGLSVFVFLNSDSRPGVLKPALGAV